MLPILLLLNSYSVVYDGIFTPNRSIVTPTVCPSCSLGSFAFAFVLHLSKADQPNYCCYHYRYLGQVYLLFLDCLLTH
jgi:hypothetical protein